MSTVDVTTAFAVDAAVVRLVQALQVLTEAARTCWSNMPTPSTWPSRQSMRLLSWWRTPEPLGTSTIDFGFASGGSERSVALA